MLKISHAYIVVTVTLLLASCSCKEPNVILDKKLNQDDVSHVDTIEYIYRSAPLDPENHLKQIITITQDSIAQEEYSHYGKKLISRSASTIDDTEFKKIKQLLLDNNIGTCNCYTAKALASMPVGCTSQSLSLYDDKKEIYSEYSSCNAGGLCGDYKKFIKDIEQYNSKLSKKEIKGLKSSIEIYKQIPKNPLPFYIDTSDDKQLLHLAVSQLKLDIKDLKLQRYQKFIVIHYENEEYIQKHPNWDVKKYGEAMVIDTSKLVYNYFRLSKT